LFSLKYPTMKSATLDLKVQASKQSRSISRLANPNGNNSAIWRCTTRVEDGELIVPDGPLSKHVCSYNAHITSHVQAGQAKFWSLKNTSMLSHSNCSGSAKPGPKVLANLYAVR
jgi:hypothetical protein